jgi:hypothetical protein
MINISFRLFVILSLTLPRYFSFRLPHLNIPTGSPSDELDKIFSEILRNTNPYSKLDPTLQLHQGQIVVSCRSRPDMLFLYK